MAKYRKRTSFSKCFAFVIIFALTSFFVEITKLFDITRNAALVKRSVNDGLSGLRDRKERSLKIFTGDKNNTVISATGSSHALGSKDTTLSVVDKAAEGIALQDLFNVWDHEIRKKATSEKYVHELQNDENTSEAGIALQNLFNVWDLQTRKKAVTEKSVDELQNEGNTSEEVIALQNLFNVWDLETRKKAVSEKSIDELQNEGDTSEAGIALDVFNLQIRKKAMTETFSNEKQNKGNTGECANLSVLPSIHNLNRSDEMVKFGFYEGHRIAWIYNSLFRKPQQMRFCNECHFESNHTVRVKLEKSASNLKLYDIVMFPQDQGTRSINQRTWRKILTNAPSHQRRVYASFEGPYKLTKSKRKPSFGAFHWSWTFNSKSEFTMPYGYYRSFIDVNSETSTKEVNPINWAEGKTSLVAWMSTWLNTNWKRSQFVEELSKLIPVHRYGKKYRNCPKGSQSCKNKIKAYKFYLALENSCCKEYITEKFWRTLNWGIVPIVVGASKEDYERLAPPNSFIFVDDFKSLEALANYLIEIDKNDTLYNEFFRWRTQGEVHQNYPNYRYKIPQEPPKSWFYSCNAVCKVTERYLRERKEFVEPRSGFDPHVDWWGRSCRKCGTQPWFEELRT